MCVCLGGVICLHWTTKNALWPPNIGAWWLWGQSLKILPSLPAWQNTKYAVLSGTDVDKQSHLHLTWQSCLCLCRLSNLSKCFIQLKPYSYCRRGGSTKTLTATNKSTQHEKIWFKISHFEWESIVWCRLPVSNALRYTLTHYLMYHYSDCQWAMMPLCW